MFRRFLFGLLLLAGIVPAQADQSTGCIPTTGTLSGLQLVTRVNAAFSMLMSMASGASAPSTTCSGTAPAGQLWLDTSTTPNVVKVYDGTSSNWLTIGTVDASAHVWTPPIGGGATSLVAAATTSLTSVPQGYITITGSTGITSFGTGTAGAIKFVRFTGTPAITYNATSMILPTAAGITATAGDTALAVSLGGSNWVVVNYQRADGTALATASALGSQIAFTGIITPTALSSQTDNWAPTGLSTASTIRASGTVDVTITGLTAQPTGTIVLLENVGSTILTLASEVTSTAANRFSLGSDLLLAPSAGVFLRYDITLARWAAVSSYSPTASQADATTGTSNSKFMTPLRVAQAIAALAVGGVKGVAVATSGSGTYFSTAGATSGFAIITGGGGGGKGVSSNIGQSGSAGATALKFYSVLPNGASFSVGAGGAAGTSGGGSGGNGGTTTLDTLSASGGTGGTVAGFTSGVAGQSTTANATLAIPGGGSDPSIGSGNDVISGTGGASFWGGGGQGVYGKVGTSVSAGANGGAWGSGGSGAAGNGSAAGGAGASGVIVIFEF